MPICKLFGIFTLIPTYWQWLLDKSLNRSEEEKKILYATSKILTYNAYFFQETQRLMQEPVPGISAIPDDDNARYFHVVVAGPEGSPFEGGVFKLELFLPEDYPMSAPKVPCLLSLAQSFDI